MRQKYKESLRYNVFKRSELHSQILFSSTISDSTYKIFRKLKNKVTPTTKQIKLFIYAPLTLADELK